MDKLEELISGGALRVENIEDLVHPYLSLRNSSKLKSIEVKTPFGDDFAVRFIGVTHLTSQPEEGAKKLARYVDEACNQYEVKGRLGSPIKFDYAKVGDGAQKSAYLYYIAFSPDSAEKIDESMKVNSRAFLKAGEMPKEVIFQSSVITGDISGCSKEEFVKYITKSQHVSTYHLDIVQFNQNLGYGYGKAWIGREEDVQHTDSVYTRQVAKLEKVSNYVEEVIKSINDEKHVQRLDLTSCESLEDAVEEASLVSLNEYGAPDKLVPLSDTTFLLAQTDAETIEYKYVVDEMNMQLLGKVLLFAPKRFVIFTVSEGVGKF